MVGQQLSQTNEKCYSVRCDPFYHYFTDLNTAPVSNSHIAKEEGPASMPSPEAEATRTAPPRPHHCGAKDFASRRKPTQICVPMACYPKCLLTLRLLLEPDFLTNLHCALPILGLGLPLHELLEIASIGNKWLLLAACVLSIYHRVGRTSIIATANRGINGWIFLNFQQKHIWFSSTPPARLIQLLTKGEMVEFLMSPNSKSRILLAEWLLSNDEMLLEEG